MHYFLFREAIKNNNIPDLRELLANKEATNSIRDDRSYMVAIAAESGNREIVELLLDHGFPVNGDSSQGEPLLNACRGKISEEETLALVEFLLSRGANPNTPGQTPLHFIARMGYTTVAARLLEAGANPLARAYGNGTQPLHDAAWKDSWNDSLWKSSVPIARILIERGADINEAAPGNGSTPLERAAQSVYNDMVNLLLQHGADPNIAKSDGNTPLHSAVERACRGWWNVSESEAQDAAKIVTQLLDVGANINAANQRGETPLFTAVGSRMNKEVLLELLERGADINALTADGVSPLAEAVSQKNEVAIEQLLAKGADPLAGNKGRSAVEAAVFRNNEPALKELLSCVRLADMSGESEALLNAAAHQDSADCLRLLLPYGLKPGGPFPAKKLTPLHKAARYGATGVLKLCLETGTDSNVTDRQGRTPLYIAARYNRPEAIELLLQFQADPDIADKAGKTPLAIAQEKNKKRAVKLLSKGQG